MKNLSLKAFGLLAYLERNEIEKLNAKDLLEMFTDGISSVYKAIHELESEGMIYLGTDPDIERTTKRYFLKKTTSQNL